MGKVGLPVRKSEQHYTYRDYRQWPEDERWELIDGVAYLMGAPARAHQHIVMTVSRRLANFLDHKPCEVYPAPLDVFFPRLQEQHEDDVDTVVQPDVVVVCDRDKLRDNGIWGAPDLVVEILSPSTSRKDLNEKYRLYERSGVREYWVVDPHGRWVQQYVLADDGKYAPEVTLVKNGVLASSVLEGLVLEIAELWEASA